MKRRVTNQSKQIFSNIWLEKLWKEIFDQRSGISSNRILILRSKFTRNCSVAFRATPQLIQRWKFFFSSEGIECQKLRSQSWNIKIDRSKRDGIPRRLVITFGGIFKKREREKMKKKKRKNGKKKGKMLERRVIGGTGWIPFGVVRSKFDWRTNRRHWRRNIRKLERPGEAGTQPRIGQWPTIGSHPIFACQFRGRYCAVDNAPIITLNGDHSYAHSAGFKPPFRIHYRRAAQIIAPMRAASRFFFSFSPPNCRVLQVASIIDR